MTITSTGQPRSEYWLCRYVVFPGLAEPADINHAAARRWAETNRVPLITSEYVLIEVANYLSPVPVRRFFGQFWRALRSDNRMTVVAASSDLPARG